MEQITKRDNVYLYGGRPCRDAEEAYGRLRDDYHRSLGRVAYKRLDRLGSRQERVHGYGFVFSGQRARDLELFGTGRDERIPVRIIGLVAGSYGRILGGWDIHCGDEEFDDWFDYIFRKGGDNLKTVGKRQKTGRTSKRLKRRYR